MSEDPQNSEKTRAADEPDDRPAPRNPWEEQVEKGHVPPPAFGHHVVVTWNDERFVAPGKAPDQPTDPAQSPAGEASVPNQANLPARRKTFFGVSRPFCRASSEGRWRKPTTKVPEPGARRQTRAPPRYRWLLARCRPATKICPRTCLWRLRPPARPTNQPFPRKAKSTCPMNWRNRRPAIERDRNFRVSPSRNQPGHCPWNHPGLPPSSLTAHPGRILTRTATTWTKTATIWTTPRKHPQPARRSL